jgi:hypothetical protein
MSETWVRNFTDKYIEQARKLDLFDCGIWLGAPEGFPLAVEKEFEELKKELKDFHIHGGLFSHWRGKTLSAQDGNRILEKKSEYFTKNMYGIWTGLPLYPEPVESGPLPGKGMVHPSMRGVRIYPASHNYITEEWVIGTLCEWLVEHNLPLFIMHTEISWASLYKLAARFSNLMIILETQTKKILYHTRVLFPLMRECHNIMVETSNFAGQGYIDYVVKEFGARRLLFGSFMPVNDPLVPIGMIIDADIGEKEKSLIASGNIRRIIEGVLH